MEASDHPSPARPIRTPLECPRCGHGLEGGALAAEARGEPGGICAECGLPVEWATLRRDAIAPRWHVEAPRPWRSLPLRGIATLVRGARPFRFWSAIDLALPFRWRGYLGLVLAVAVAMHLVAVVSRFAPGARFWDDVSALRALGNLGNPDSASHVAADVALILLSPASKFRGSDLLSAARREVGTSGPVALPLARLVAKAVYAPFAESTATFTRIRGVGRVPTRINAGGSPLLPPVAWPTVVASACAALLSPLAILLLPTSLRRARVRKLHLVRIAANGLILVVPVLALAIGLESAGAQYHLFSIEPMTPYGRVNAHLVLPIGAGAFAALWTTAASRRYLRLPRAAGVGCASAAIGVLVAVHLLFILTR